MSGFFIFRPMIGRYLLASFFGALIGAGCVLVVVYVTNSRALVMDGDVNSAVNSLHTRINDFYIFAGIVITLLLAINVGVYIKADEEVDKHFRENFDKYEKEVKKFSKKAKKDDTE